jgi:uncharacterized protein
VHDGIWITETEGPGRAVTKHFFGDDKGSNFDTPSTRWPDFADRMPPRPSIVVVTKQDGGFIGA